MRPVRPVSPWVPLVLAAALLTACTIPTLERLRREAAAQSAPASVVIRPGDTVYGIARRYGLSTQAVIDANRLQPPYTVRPGQVLRLPGTTGHAVRRGDSLYAISRRYDVTVADLARLNGLRPPYTIYVGQHLILPPPDASSPSHPVEATPAQPVPEGPPTVVAAASALPPLPPRRPEPGVAARGETPPIPPRPLQLAAAEARQIALPAIPTPQARSAAGFQWPVAGALVSRFGPKDDGRHNDGVNIAAAAGTPVVAADNGVVAYAGNELRGYGNLLLIRHDDDWVTAYGHTDRLLVRRGDRVRAGQRIATVGSSGSVGTPQLHFEIRRGAVAVDPLDHLPPLPEQVGAR